LVEVDPALIEPIALVISQTIERAARLRGPAATSCCCDESRQESCGSDGPGQSTPVT
jgi:hypothetical protein